jgi:hypothetical protein
MYSVSPLIDELGHVEYFVVAWFHSIFTSFAQLTSKTASKTAGNQSDENVQENWKGRLSRVDWQLFWQASNRNELISFSVSTHAVSSPHKAMRVK